MRSLLFGEQSEFIDDPSKSKAAVCSRRAGKTFMACTYLALEALQYPSSTLAYVAITRPHAYNLLWHPLKRFDEKFGIGIKFEEKNLIALFPNGSRLILGGARTLDELEKFRGFGFRLVLLDEAGSMKTTYLQYFVDEILGATMMDVRGTMCLLGTPNASCTGFFKEATTGKTQWSVHKWTCLDNVHLNDVEGFLSELKEKNGWNDNNPVYRREYKGEWVRSEDSLVYHFLRDRDVVSSFVSGFDPSYLLGLDIGYDDATAFVVIAYDARVPYVYILDCYKESKLTIDEIAEKVKFYEKKYDFVRKVADSGGLGKMIIEELNKRHALNIKAAEKQDKQDFIELMNSDFHSGRIKVYETKGTQELMEEWDLLLWDYDRAGDKRKEDASCENHLADACLYAWRESKHWVKEPMVNLPKRGDEGWHTAEEDRMLELEIERVQRLLYDRQEF